jgi:eukaryotic-like serine/threonine-protein kinase
LSQGRAAAPEPSEIAGRYQVVQKLGAGAFGTVYKVKDKILGRMLAIKTIRLEGLAAAGASLEELMNRFTREAQVSAQLKHPNIVTIYDIGEADGLSYLSMEFIDGVGLDRVIAQAGKLPVERAAALGAQVADALDFAHRNRVVHRDIKPANIMIEPGDRVKVTDFGIAKVTESGDHLTMTGSLLGTPSYMSPEQARGSELDGRSDLFAVGCILYEMLTGQKAFRGDSITGLIFKIITEEPRAIHELEPGVPEEMVRIIKRALSKAPETRYQSGRELAEDLLTLTHGGAMPTLRSSETDTAREVAGALPTLRSSPTVAGAPPTQVKAPAPPPADPTKLMPTPPPLADPTRLVGSAPAPPAPPPAAAPRTAAPPPPSPRAAAPSARPTPPPRPAPSSSSKTGLVIVLAVVGLLVVGGGGLAGLYFLVLKPKPPVTTDGGTETVTPTTLAESTSPTLATTADNTGTVESPAPTGGESVPPATSGTSGTTSSVTTPTGSTGTTADRTSGTAAATGRTGGASTRATDPGTVTPRDPGGSTGADSLAFLDTEPPVLNGREQGAAVADTYRSQYGRNSSGNFGASGRMRARPRVPPDLSGSERRAAAALLHMMSFEAAYERKNGRYGNFGDVLPGKPGSPSLIQRYGYRFDLKVESDGYRIVATPLALGTGRALLADDSGFVRYADE